MSVDFLWGIVAGFVAGCFVTGIVATRIWLGRPRRHSLALPPLR